MKDVKKRAAWKIIIDSDSGLLLSVVDEGKLSQVAYFISKVHLYLIDKPKWDK